MQQNSRVVVMLALCALCGCGGGSAPVGGSQGGSVPVLNPPDGFKATISANTKTAFDGSRGDVPPQIIVFSTNIPGAVTWTAAPPTGGTLNVLSAGTIDAATGIFTPARPIHLANNQAQASNVAATSVNNPHVSAVAQVVMANY